MTLDLLTGVPELRQSDKLDTRSASGAAQAVIESVLGQRILRCCSAALGKLTVFFVPLAMQCHAELAMLLHVLIEIGQAFACQHH